MVRGRGLSGLVGLVFLVLAACGGSNSKPVKSDAGKPPVYDSSNPSTDRGNIPGTDANNVNAGRDAGQSMDVPVYGNRAPTVKFMMPEGMTQMNAMVGVPVDLRVRYEDPDGDLPQFKFTDGENSTPMETTEPSFRPMYLTEGRKLACVEASDGKGGMDSDCLEIIVRREENRDGGNADASMPDAMIMNRNPIASLSASKTVAFVNEDIVLNASQSTDPDGDLLLFDYVLGDGTTRGEDLVPTVVKAYTMPGPYTAVVNVNDGRGGRASDSIDLIIQPKERGLYVNAGPDADLERDSLFCYNPFGCSAEELRIQCGRPRVPYAPGSSDRGFDYSPDIQEFEIYTDTINFPNRKIVGKKCTIIAYESDGEHPYQSGEITRIKIRGINSSGEDAIDEMDLSLR